jgi:hypothetical protein
MLFTLSFEFIIKILIVNKKYIREYIFIFKKNILTISTYLFYI